ncbi:MAG: hypothetical protein QF440_06780 [Candidatus Thalassarchaeaceae archaeon]|jgi:hypothetical protein|nr:hypothetical protein [Candidatus Thalassarchaeaceae archaeon]
MVNPRATVLGVVFTLLLGASIFTIARDGGVDVTAWALLGLTVAFAAATVIAFFTEEERTSFPKETGNLAISHSNNESQNLPNPEDVGFDIPIL